MGRIVGIVFILMLVAHAECTDPTGRLLVYTNANDDEPVSTFSSTTRQLNLAIGAAQAIGTLSWTLSFGQNNFIRIVPTRRHILESPVVIQRVFTEDVNCKLLTRAIRSRPITPDASFSSSPGAADGHLARPGYKSGWTATLPCWLAVDLGGIFRLFQIGHYGAIVASPGQLVYTYQLHYGLSNANLTLYSEGNGTKIFQNPVDNGWDIYRLDELSEPAYGQIFKIEPLSGTNPVGIAFELHGCAVDTMNGMTVMKSRRSPLLQDVGEVTDGDVNTCVSVPANDMATIMVPILDAQNYSVTVKTLTTHDDSCFYYNDANVFVMVKAGPPFRSISRGVYRKCVVGLKYDESTLSAQLFECTCTYGPCEGVYVKIQSKCRVSVCSIEVF